MATTNRNTKARGYCVTINNYTDEDIAYIRGIDCHYKVWGKEVAPTTGTKHLQCFFYWENPRSFNMVKTLFRNWHIEQAKGNSFQNREYCIKDGDWEELGSPPTDPRAGGKTANAARWEQARDAAKRGAFDEVPADIHLRCYHTLQRIRDDALLGGTHSETEAQMLWYYGPAGTGKSRTARDENPGCYLKMCNRWWDGYKGEDVVLLEDFDRDHSKLVHYLKIWADRYPFPCEVKGGSLMIRPKLIIVTSNYHPEEIWDREGDLRPIMRRFKCVKFMPNLGDAPGAPAETETGGAHCDTFNPPKKFRSDYCSGDY